MKGFAGLGDALTQSLLAEVDDGLPQWRTPSQLRQLVHHVTGELYSDGSVTRRLRELSDALGPLRIERRRKPGTRPDGKPFREWEYRCLGRKRR